MKSLAIYSTSPRLISVWHHLNSAGINMSTELYKHLGSYMIIANYKEPRRGWISTDVNLIDTDCWSDNDILNLALLCQVWDS